MVIQCCNCRKILGEKEPLINNAVTHSICDDCLKVLYPGAYEKKRLRKKCQNEKLLKILKSQDENFGKPLFQTR